MKRKSQIFIVFCSFIFQMANAGISLGTLVKTKKGHMPVEQIKVGTRVMCHVPGEKNSARTVKNICVNKSNTAYIIHCKNGTLRASGEQLFYDPVHEKWVPAQKLNSDNFLMDCDANVWPCAEVTCEKETVLFYDLVLESPHLFFISDLEILTHNFVPVAIGVTLSIGGGEIAFAGISAGIGILGCWIGAHLLGNDSRSVKITCIPIDEEDGSPNLYIKKNSKANGQENKCHDAQVPGKPTKNDGYEPPKNWDGKKVKHPKTGKVGWPDKKGNVWVPTGPGSQAHGGPHWDVQHPNGKTYDNIYPGGRVRPGKK